ncbi:hypothetical protein Ththe16_1997 (plasmid) [Thermus thermophilus SG0.5JP17-16]|uniref:HAMP domain-containing protein n=1 Tax=Thermus thermophilus (strain SG0.5JP17-16) TaxID=762633 RepID=F6DIY9_THETG|nr:hypothetical protein [Thermus thermophilus]AEG34386.1 hypothetical protein Ththe16_1997 [Thermus thermophilus SG0.5JP17-16]
MRRTRKHLEEMAQAARALALYAEDLHALLSERPLEAERVAREVEEAVGELRGLVSRLYALEARLKAPYEDNSAAALRELFGEV